MKSLFESIRSGVITKPACEEQLRKYKHDKMLLTREYLARKLGADLYTKKLGEFNLSIDLLQMVVDKFEDFKLPLKVKPAETGRTLDDEGPNFSTES